MKGFSFILSLLVMVFFSIGCKPIDDAGSGSGLTSISLNTGDLLSAVSKKAKDYRGLELNGYAILIVGYDSNNQIKLKCYNPPQKNDSNTQGDCVLPEATQQEYDEKLKATVASSSNTNTLRLFADNINVSLNTIKNGSNNALTLPFPQSGKLSEMKIRYNPNYTYYGYMLLSCNLPSENISNSNCLYPSSKIPAEYSNNTLNIQLSLKWFDKWNSKNDVTVKGTGDVPDTDTNDDNNNKENNNTKETDVNMSIKIDE